MRSPADRVFTNLLFDRCTHPVSQSSKGFTMRDTSHSGRHTRRNRTAVPVTEFLTPNPDAAPRHRRRPRSDAPAVHQPSANLALAAATAVTLAFTPAIAQHAPALHLPTLTAPHVALTALVDPAAVSALQKAVSAELAALDSTVANIVGVPGQTLATALSAASSLSGTFWSALTAAAGNNPLLASALGGLNTLTTGGLTALASTITEGNNAIVLSTQQVSTLLTSTLAGAAATAALALSRAVANPLSLAGLAGLVDAPFTVGGQVLSSVITAAANLSDNAIGLAGSLVTTAVSQINSALAVVNNLVSSVGDASGSNLVAGVLTAVQAIVSTPVTALLAGVSGGATALVHAGTTVVDTVAGAAQDVNNIWLGGTTGNGAIQAIIGEIASGPLDVGHYVAAVTTLTQAALATVTKPVITLVAGTAAVPIRFTADAVNAGAHIASALVTGAAALAAGLAKAAGLPPALIGTIYTAGQAVNAGISLGANVVTAGLNTAASLLNGIIHATGLVTPAAAVPAPTSKLVSLPATTKTAATRTQNPTAATTSATGSTSAATGTTATSNTATTKAVGTDAKTATTTSKHGATPATAPQTPTTDPKPAHETTSSDKPAHGAVKNPDAGTTKNTTAGSRKHSRDTNSDAKAPSGSGKHTGDASHHGGAHD